MVTTLLTGLGTTSSFLMLFFYIVTLFGIPLVLIALRVMEIISENRHDRVAIRMHKRERELLDLEDDLSIDEPGAGGHIISSHDMKKA